MLNPDVGPGTSGAQPKPKPKRRAQTVTLMGLVTGEHYNHLPTNQHTDTQTRHLQKRAGYVPAPSGTVRGGTWTSTKPAGEAKPYWKPNMNLPNLRQLQQLRSKIGNDYVMARYLDSLSYNYINMKSALYKDHLYETQSTDPTGTRVRYNPLTGAPEYWTPDGQKVSQHPLQQHTTAKGAQASTLDEAFQRFGIALPHAPASKVDRSFVSPDTGEVIREINGKWYTVTKDKHGNAVHTLAGAYNSKYHPDLFDKAKDLETTHTDKSDDGWGWLGDAAGAVGHVVSEAAKPVGFLAHPWVNAAKDVGHVIAEGADAVTPDGTGKHLKSGGSHLLDALFAPLAGVVGAEQYLINQDDEHGAARHKPHNAHPDFLHRLEENVLKPYTETQKFLTGGRLASDSLDDLNVGDIGGVLKAAGTGFGHAFTGKEVDTFSHMIHHNASTDPVQDKYDNPVYQLLAGLGGDVAYDPLNFLGVGPISKGVQAVRNAAHLKHGEQLFSDSEKADKLITKLGKSRIPKSIFDNTPHKKLVDNLESEGQYLTPEDLRQLLMGDIPKTFKTPGQQSRAFQKAAGITSVISKHLDATAGGLSARHTKQYQSMIDSLTKLNEQRHAITHEAATDTLIEDVTKDVAKDAAVGKATVDPEQFKDLLHHNTVAAAFKSDRDSVFKPETKAKPFMDFLGDGFKDYAGDLLPKFDTLKRNIDKHLRMMPTEEIGVDVNKLLEENKLTSKLVRAKGDAYRKKVDELRANGVDDAEIKKQTEALSLSYSGAAKRHKAISERVDALRAKAFLHGVKEISLAAKTGKTRIIINPQREKELDAVANELGNRAHLADTSTYVGSDKPELTVHADDPTAGRRQLDLRDYDLSTSGGIKALFDDTEGFDSVAAHHEAIDSALSKAYERNRSHLGQFTQIKTHVPAALSHSDGTPDWDKIHKYVGYEFNDSKYKARLFRKTTQIDRDFPGNTEIQTYIQRFVDDVMDRTGELHQKLLRNATDRRRVDEKIKATGEAKTQLDKITRLREDDPEVYKGDKFRSSRVAAAKRIPADSLLPVGPNNEGLSFAISLARKGEDEKFVFLNSKVPLAEQFKAAGINVTAADKLKVKSILDVVRKAQHQGATTNEIRATIDVLRDLGLDVPENTRLFKAWSESLFQKGSKNAVAQHLGKYGSITNFDELVKQLTPEKVTFFRRFYKQHHMTLSEAQGERDIALGESERALRADLNSAFKQRFEGGLARKQFFAKATASADDLFEAVHTSPFPLISKDGGHLANYTRKLTGNPEVDDAILAVKQTREHPGDSAYFPTSKQWNIYKQHVEDTTREFTQKFWDDMQHDPEWGINQLVKGWEKHHGQSRKGRLKAEGAAKKAGNETQAVLDKEALQAERQNLLGSVDINDPGRSYDIYKHSLTQSMQAAREQLGELSHLPDSPLDLSRPITSRADFDAEFKSVVDELTKPKKDELAILTQHKATISSTDKDQLAEIDAKIQGVKDDLAALQVRVDKYRKRALASAKATKKLMAEEVAIKILEHTRVVADMPGVKLSLLGQDHLLRLPDNQHLRAMFAKMSSNKAVDAARWAYQHTFAPPVGTLPYELQLPMYRARNLTDQVIRFHLDKLREDFGDLTNKELRDAWAPAMYKSGQGTDQSKALYEHFSSLAQYFNREARINGSPVTVDNIMRYMPTKYQLSKSQKRGDYGSGMKLMDAVMHLPNTSFKDLNVYDYLWNTRIAVEKAISLKLLKENINQMHGVKTYQSLAKNRAVTAYDEQLARSADGLKSLGWETIPEMGGTHYFPPEMIAPIKRVIALTEPRNSEDIGGFIDKVMAMTKIDSMTRGWKISATAYSVPYYEHNMVGEVMTAWLGGVNNPIYFKKALSLANHAHKNQDLREISSHLPWAQHLAKPRDEFAKAAAKRTNGEELTKDDLLALWQDQGMQTGFIDNTLRGEHGVTPESRLKGKAADVTAPVRKFHHAVLKFGELNEDIPRMAHFIHAIEHAPAHLTTQEAAEFAAFEVRKYHFDYMDVNRFEQTVAARLFPFYKWTRKALPLMAEMFFVKPGKMTAYPKVMSTLSSLSTQDMESGLPGGEGAAPHYEDLVPGWLMAQWAYRLGTDKEGKNTYGNLVTPQIDSLKAVTDPQNAMQGLLNPLISVPMEIGQGHPLDPSLSGVDINTNKDRLETVLRKVPTLGLGVAAYEGNQPGKDGAILDPSGGPTGPFDEKLAKYFSGIGLYEDPIHLNTGEDYDTIRNVAAKGSGPKRSGPSKKQVADLLEKNTGFRNLEELTRRLDAIKSTTPNVVD